MGLLQAFQSNLFGVDIKQADVGIVGRRNLFRPTRNLFLLGEALQGHVHIGLPSGNPYFAAHYILEFKGIAAFNR